MREIFCRSYNSEKNAHVQMWAFFVKLAQLMAASQYLAIYFRAIAFLRRATKPNAAKPASIIA